MRKVETRETVAIRRSGAWPAALLLAVATLATPPGAGAQPAGEPEPAAEPDGAPVHAGVGELRVAVAPEEVTVGDRVTAELTLVWLGAEPVEAPRFPTWQESWGTAEVLDVSGVEAFTDQSGRRIYRQTVTLTAFETGGVELPPVTVAVPLAERTEEVESPEELGFEVVSVLPEDAGEGEIEPQPPAPPLELRTGDRFLWTAAALGALALLAAVQVGRRATLVQGVAGAALRPRPAPFPELLERLGRLDPADAEGAHTGLSLALRDFLGRRLGFHAVESTTTEIHRHLHRSVVDPATSHELLRLFRDCDQVKFARQEVPRSTTEARIAQGQQLAEKVRRTPGPGDGDENDSNSEDGGERGTAGGATAAPRAPRGGSS
jgi:hypothetical protein